MPRRGAPLSLRAGRAHDSAVRSDPRSARPTTDPSANDERLRELIRGGEGQHVEFKRSPRQLGRALEALCGMLNAGGEALVVFGIGPEEQVVGIDPANLESTRRSLVRAVANNISPSVRPELAVVRLDGQAVVTLSATRRDGVSFYECRGQAYVRVGAETLRMSPFERAALTTRRGRGADGEAAGGRGGP